MFVGQRHDEPVETLGFQLLAKSGEAVGMAGHARFLVPLESGNKLGGVQPRLASQIVW
jgi:hypothetical protein